MTAATVGHKHLSGIQGRNGVPRRDEGEDGVKELPGVARLRPGADAARRALNENLPGPGRVSCRVGTRTAGYNRGKPEAPGSPGSRGRVVEWQTQGT